jgi:hypothetical protein
MECQFESCKNKLYAKGFCQNHYRKFVYYGDPSIKRRSTSYSIGAICEAGDCKSKPVAKNLCPKHYTRLKRHGSANAVVRLAKYHDPQCTLILQSGDRCQNRVTGKGMCDKHYNAWYKYKDPFFELEKPERNPGNYISIKAPKGHSNACADGSILEHRLIMSEHLGRPLAEGENVHHINGNRHDNRLENLELWNTRQPYGQRVEDKVNYALEILSLYAPEKLRNSND